MNLEKIPFSDITGKEQFLRIDKEDFGNALYMSGLNIEECELGKKIYHSDGEVEINQKEAEIFSQAAQRFGYSYIALEAIKKALTPEKP